MHSPISLSSLSLADALAYDVFLSFRGPDVRSGFARDLFNALLEKGAKTFMDDKKLRKGEEITPAIMKAIQQSRISIVIFSENYASSFYCLEELVEIMQCYNHQSMVVFPVFCEVDPSVVRHQRKSYAEALTKHKERYDDKKIKKWRLALKQAADLNGWHLNGRDQREVIGEIVQEVSEVILANYPTLDQSLVQKGKALDGVKSDDGVQATLLGGVEYDGGVPRMSFALKVVSKKDTIQARARVEAAKSKDGVHQLVSFLDVQ